MGQPRSCHPFKNTTICDELALSGAVNGLGTTGTSPLVRAVTVLLARLAPTAFSAVT